jgi:hypothetical protein
VATAIEDVARPPSADALNQRLERLEETRDESSQRLRLELDELRRRFDSLSSRPLEVDNIRFPPRLVVGIVAAVMAIVGGMYASTYGLRSDVRDILTTMANQEKVDVEKEKLTTEKQRLSDEKFQSLRDAVSVIDRRQQLQQIETAELKEMVIKQGVSK